MSTRVRFTLLLGLLCLALVVAGCQDKSTPTSQTGMQKGEPYKIGAVFDITGPASSLGIPERDTVEMLQKQLEAAGGIMGPDGLMHPVQVVIYDGESDETKTVLAVKKLIEEDQVSVIVGPTQSGTSLAVVDSVQKAQIPLISCAASIKIVEPVAERHWVFKTTYNDRLLIAALINDLKDMGITQVAWMSVNTGYGDSGRGEFEAAAPQAGLNIVASERFEATDTDMTAQLTKIRGTDAQAIVIWSIPPSASIANKNAHDLGITLPIFQSGGVANQSFIELATKEAVEGVILHAGRIIVAEQLPDSDPQKTVLLDYKQDYEAATGAQPNPFGGHAWDAFNLAVQIMSKVGPDRTKIRDELERTQGFVGITGVFNFSADNHTGLDESSVVSIQIADGQWKLVQK